MPAIVCQVVACYPFRERGGRVEFLILQRRPGAYLAGVWQGVQGKIEAGETAWQAALREMLEESGLRPRHLWQLQFVDTYYVAPKDAVHLTPCFAAQVRAEAEVRLSQEHTAYRWESSEEVQGALLWPGQRSAVREILAEITRPGAAEPFLRIELGPEWIDPADE
ncbi:8-oxo-dGTP diphosphatase [Phycisphaerae bacterium RAS1]|nr:8-oxo-dGTP diphosphatase [Phycisphaerae bacterium RAS1]